MSGRNINCQWYIAFGHCDPRHKCADKHEGTIAEQSYFCARIKENSNGVTLLRPNDREERFYVARGWWHNADVKIGDDVLFQASESRHRRTNTKMGRVVAKLRTSFPRRMFSGEVSTDGRLVEVFTIDPEGTNLRDDGYSIECGKCATDECKVIGIHISAAALQGSSEICGSEIPPYPVGSLKKTLFSLNKDTVVPAISVYLHTECKYEFGPVLTQVKVIENYSYSDLDKYRDDFDVLRKYFDKTTVFDTDKHTYVVSYPQTWQQRYVIQEMMMEFQSHVQKQHLVQKQQHLITKQWKSYSCRLEEFRPNETKDVIISKKIYDKFVEENAKQTSDSGVVPFVAAVLESNLPRHPMKKTFFMPKNDYKIQTSAPLDQWIIPCTSPMRKLKHYINQQILLNSMFGNPPLYADEDLWGILVTRFSTPSLLAAAVVEMRKTNFELRYLDIQGISPTICQVPYSIFQSNPAMLNEKVEIYFSNPSWKTGNYCNQDLVRLKPKTVYSLLVDMEQRESGPYVNVTAEELDVEKSPYKDEDDGDAILFVLQTGAELRLQISNTDARNKTGFGLRLLKIGEGCHFCITHFTRPDIAFKSERTDVRELVAAKSNIAGLKDATVEQKLAGSLMLHKVSVEWPKLKGEGEYRSYYSQGLFCTNENLVDGDLLCIRKEIRNDSGEYVWCCHGVVSNVEYVVSDIEPHKKVTFKVCTLMQSDQYPGPEDFCVEIVKWQVTAMESRHVEKLGVDGHQTVEMDKSVKQNDSL